MRVHTDPFRRFGYFHGLKRLYRSHAGLAACQPLVKLKHFRQLALDRQVGQTSKSRFLILATSPRSP